MNTRSSATFWIVALAGLVTLKALAGADDQPREPILEAYSFTLGGTTVGTSLRFHDDAFGNGTAKCQIVTRSNEDRTRTLWFRVHRRVPPDTIVFALLCPKITIRCLDTEGNVVFSRRLRGFTFGDSASGTFSRSFSQLPPTTSRVELTFFGNYE